MKLKNELTKKEKEILGFINDHVQASGSPPSIREIGQRFNIKSTSHVAYYLKKLVRKGFIKRDRKARGIIVAAKKSAIPGCTRLPILGKVPAGVPIMVVEDIEGYINVDEDLARGETVFALRVKGDSMSGAGIMDGDIVVVRQQPLADSGEIVVAQIEGEATVKRLKIENDKIILQPENNSYEPIVTDKASVIGKVISLIRKYNKI